MIPYLRSILCTAAAIGLAVAVAWPNAQAAAEQQRPIVQPDSSSAAPAYFLAAAILPDADGPTRAAHSTSATLDEQYVARAHLVRTRAGLDASTPIPSDTLASLLRLPRTISPAEALAQVERVAAARALPPAELAALVAQHTEYGPLGLGAPVVNVPLLNLALDALDALD